MTTKHEGQSRKAGRRKPFSIATTLLLVVGGKKRFLPGTLLTPVGVRFADPVGRVRD